MGDSGEAQNTSHQQKKMSLQSIPRVSHTITFNGFRQDNGRLIFMLISGLVSGKDLNRIMTTTIK
jgi:pyruvate dehydrogenase complex dehydrogenase (E1) component